MAMRDLPLSPGRSVSSNDLPWHRQPPLRSLLIPLAAVFLATPGCASPKWEYDPAQAFRQAQRTNRLVLVHYSSLFCQYCAKMDREVFTDADVRTRLRDFVLLRKDYPSLVVEAERIGITGTPGFVVYRPDTTAVGQPQIGYMDAAEFRAFLAAVKLQR